MELINQNENEEKTDMSNKVDFYFFFFINPPEPNLTNKSQKFHSYLVMPYRPINFYFCDGN